MTNQKEVTIKAPAFQTAVFKLTGTAPLIIHRFSAKVKEQMLVKMEAGKSASSKKNRDPKDIEATYNEARYISKEGWDGFNASAVRCACIDVCRLVNFKMTLAKMSIFCLADGWDATEPQIPLVRIIGKPVMQQDMARVETGQPYITIRAAYHDWKANVKIRWDFDQFSLADVTNLIMRVGVQCGIGEGRPFSKNSAGMGWGTFDVSGGEK